MQPFQELLEKSTTDPQQVVATCRRVKTQFSSFSDIKEYFNSQNVSKNEKSKKTTTIQSEKTLRFPRAIVTAPCFPDSSDQLAVSSGCVVEILSGSQWTTNPVGLPREGYFCASYGGCIGWIPEENCRVLIEPPHNQRFIKQGYASFVDFPTTNDWFFLKGFSRVLREEQGTVIVEKGNKFQRFFLIVDGEVCVNTGNCKFTLGPYYCFGSAPMLLGTLSVCTVTITSPEATILQFDSSALKKAFSGRPQIAASFFKYLCCDLHEQILLLHSLLRN